MSRFDYVRQHYNMPWLKRGVRVLANGEPGTVMSATMHIKVRLDGEKHGHPYHPHDVVRVDDGGAS